MTTPPLLIAERLLRRGPDAAQPLLDARDLAVSAGDRIVVGGPSGSGKTLLLRALALFDPLDEGGVRWQGQRVDRDRVPGFRGLVHYFRQRPVALAADVENALRQPFRLQQHRRRAFDRRRVVAWLEALGRTDRFLQRRTRELSGGEMQLVALVRGLQLDPAILLLDEPTAALDPATTDAVQRMLAEWLQQQPRQRAYLWVTHDQRQARHVGNRAWHVHGGRVTETSRQGPD